MNKESLADKVQKVISSQDRRDPPGSRRQHFIDLAKRLSNLPAREEVDMLSPRQKYEYGQR